MKVGVIIWLSAVFCMSGGDFLISCIFQFFFSKISISKAFDKVWHAGLLCKLQVLGVQPLLLQLFESYLLNRKQRVVQYRRAILWFANSQLRSPSRVFDSTASIFLFISMILLVISPLFLWFMPMILHCSRASRLNWLSKFLSKYKISRWADKWLVAMNPVKPLNVAFSRKRNIQDWSPASISWHQGRQRRWVSHSLKPNFAE